MGQERNTEGLRGNITWLVFLLGFFVATVVVAIHFLIQVWPTADEKFPIVVSVFWNTVNWELVSKEVQFIVLVATVGALGGSLHGAGDLTPKLVSLASRVQP